MISTCLHACVGGVRACLRVCVRECMRTHVCVQGGVGMRSCNRVHHYAPTLAWFDGLQLDPTPAGASL